MFLAWNHKQMIMPNSWHTVLFKYDMIRRYDIVTILDVYDILINRKGIEILNQYKKNSFVKIIIIHHESISEKH